MPYKNALEKGLHVLELVNDRVTVRVKELEELTGIPSPSLVRILRTLQDMGYVVQVSRNSGYRVASRVMALSSGFHGAPKIVAQAGPYLDDLTRRKLWPASLASLDLDAMVVRYSTIPISPYSHKQSTIERRLSLAKRAHGRAYLAFCTRIERRSLFSRMPEETVRGLEPMLALYKQRGWAVRDPSLEPQTNSIAVPLIDKDRRLQGTIGFTYFRKAVDAKEERVLAEELQQTAALIVSEA
ncbi:helix-turn-helix domain-containing protein [Pseudoroseicyclus sp. CXY001]|uniref:IclR family transcriptional regulator domain-containing protein n=1 Tax=Pseudoroseicyclus sp. CXY001 TaxID=3242492 RepID=UPI00358DC3B2